MTLQTTADQTDMAPPTTVTSNTAPPTTVDEVTTTSSVADTRPTTGTTMSKDSGTTTKNQQTGTTKSLDEDITQFITRHQTTTMESTAEEKDVVTAINECYLPIILSAASLATSLVAIITSVLVLALQLQLKKEFQSSKLKAKSVKNELPKMEEFTTHINPTRIFHTYTSPIYNPYFNEDKDDLIIIIQVKLPKLETFVYSTIVLSSLLLLGLWCNVN